MISLTASAPVKDGVTMERLRITPSTAEYVKVDPCQGDFPLLVGSITCDEIRCIVD